MKAVVLDTDRLFHLQEREVPTPARDEVLLKVDLCGICGTDLHAPHYDGLFLAPVIVGHEFAATVTEVGAAVRDFEVGTRVVANPGGLTCGRCAQCRAGLTNQCAVVNASEIIGIRRDGGMAEYISLPPRVLHVLPDSVPAAIGAWTEPVAVAVRAVHHSGLGLGSSVAVFGAGPIGQLVLQVARAAGAGETLVVENSGLRRKIALECGAAAAIDGARVGEVDRKYDVVFDCSGSTAVFNPGVELVGFNGKLVVVGGYHSAVQLDMPAAAHGREISISWSLSYRDEQEFAVALGLLTRGQVDVEPLTSATLSIDDHEEAFEAMRNPELAVKNMIAPAGV